MSIRVGFIGAGNMARTIILGLLRSGWSPSCIYVSSPTIETQHTWHQSHGIHVTSDNHAVFSAVDVVVLSVKPHRMADVCKALQQTAAQHMPIVVSIAAGLTASRIQAWLGQPHAPVARAMPNLGVAVNAGVTGLWRSYAVSSKQKEQIESLFRALGVVTWFERESQLHALTAVAGSGSGYFFYLFDAMQKAAESMGIDPAEAKLLVAQTAIGAAKMSLESEESFAQLQDYVTSAKGVTAAALSVFDQRHLGDVMHEGMQAALKKSQDLSE